MERTLATEKQFHSMGTTIYPFNPFSPITKTPKSKDSKPKFFISCSLTSSEKRGVGLVRKEAGESLRSEAKLDKVERGEVEEVESLGLKDYFEQSKELIRLSYGGSPRWFSPLGCGTNRLDNPLLLFLPGIEGDGLGLIRHHQRLGEIFDIWCLHIPITDRTPFSELVKLVERTVRSENYHSPKRPIYLVGESIGACLALAVAAHNPDIDLVLILANPATSFNKSHVQAIIPMLKIMPDQLHLGLPYMLTLITGIPSKMAIATMEKELPLHQIVGELSQNVAALSNYLSGLVDVLPVEALQWKLEMLKSACAYANSRLDAVKAQTLILASGKDQLLPSLEEGKRLYNLLPRCEIRTFSDSGHGFFLEDGPDLVTILMGASFYRRSRNHNYALDYVPPSPSEFKRVKESHQLIEKTACPVMFTTLEDGKIVRGLEGIPSEGPVLYVGYHNMLGIEVYHLVSRIWEERKILLRGVAHPLMFTKFKGGRMPDISEFDHFRVMGAVPVSATNFFRLFSEKSHVLLYPGGLREALHRKGEEYKLFWPEQAEFIRMAARFGAKIVPFGVVGEDDVGQLVLDYDDQMKIPFLKAFIEETTEEAVNLRTETAGEVENQDVHLPVNIPKIPGRFDYYFGKPIDTEGRQKELKSREKSHELYLEVKSEVEKCLSYLLEKRESDPYRNIIPRFIYQVTHGFDAEVPTFEP